MGCNSSKNKVHIVGEAPTRANNISGSTPRTTPSARKEGRRPKSSSQRSVGGDSLLSDRGNSATSKVSKRTMDSGYEDTEYRHVITEDSDPNKVKEVEEGFDSPDGLDLGISGRAVAPSGSAKDRDRADEQRILAALQEEGLIQRPVAQKQAGISFEVVAMDEDAADLFSAPRRPPPRLAKLETKRKKKKELTEEQIQAKLARAEQRRLAKEQERLERVKDVSYKSAEHVAMSHDTQLQELTAQFQREKTKLETAQENREKQLEERREKQRRKKERMEAAKQRKLAAALAAAQQEGDEGKGDMEEVFGTAKPKVTEDSPIIVVKPVDYGNLDSWRQ